MLSGAARYRITLNAEEYRVESEAAWAAFLDLLSAADLDEPGPAPDLGPADLVFAFAGDRWVRTLESAEIPGAARDARFFLAGEDGK